MSLFILIVPEDPVVVCLACSPGLLIPVLALPPLLSHFGGDDG